MLNFIVPEEESDQTILSFLKKRLRSTPKSLVYKLFRKKKVKVNGNPLRFYHHRLKSNDRILLEDKFLKEEKINLEFYPASKEKNYFVVNYEDENILIVTKEHNVSMPSLDNSVQNYFFKNQKDFYQKMIESYFVFTAAHRLDKLTKGLVIYPKNFPSKKIIYNSISDKELITKNYLTLIEKKRDNFLPNYVEGYIYKDSKGQKMIFSKTKPEENKKAKFCSLKIKTAKNQKEIIKFFPFIKSSKDSLLMLEINLETGRKHQIRSILSYFNKPIVGDEKYGSKKKIKEKICLLAFELKFDHLPFPLDYLNKKEFSLDKVEFTDE